jgi:hypothetical protein
MSPPVRQRDGERDCRVSGLINGDLVDFAERRRASGRCSSRGPDDACQKLEAIITRTSSRRARTAPGGRHRLTLLLGTRHRAGLPPVREVRRCSIGGHTDYGVHRQ